MRILILSKDAPKYIYIYIYYTADVKYLFYIRWFWSRQQERLCPLLQQKGRGKGKGLWKPIEFCPSSYTLNIDVACTLATFFGTNVTLFVVLIEADYVKVIIATGCYFDEVILCGCRVLLSFSYVYNSAMDCSGFLGADGRCLA